MLCFHILLTTYNVKGSTEDVQWVLNSTTGCFKSAKNTYFYAFLAHKPYGRQLHVHMYHNNICTDSDSSMLRRSVITNSKSFSECNIRNNVNSNNLKHLLLTGLTCSATITIYTLTSESVLFIDTCTPILTWFTITLIDI